MTYFYMKFSIMLKFVKGIFFNIKLLKRVGMVQSRKPLRLIKPSPKNVFNLDISFILLVLCFSVSGLECVLEVI